MMESMSIYPTKSEVYAVSGIGEVDIPILVHYSAPTECKGNCINVNRLVAHFPAMTMTYLSVKLVPRLGPLSTSS